MKIGRKKLTLTSVYLTFFVDNLSWAIVFPIFAPYFLNPDNPILPEDLAQGTRATILGFFLMAFSLGQFLGAPLIGEYADKHGRKRALALAVFFTLIGLTFSAFGMQIHSLPLLFFSRLVTGLFAGSTSVCLSCITDLSETETEKVKNFGYLSTVAGLAFVVGAFAGGKLSDPTINSSFSPNFPIWLAAGFTLINLFFVLFGFKETSVIHPSVKFHVLEAFHHVKVALRTHKIKRIYLVYFLFLSAWVILFQFVPVLTVEKFYFSNSNLGDLALFMGVCWAIGSGYINHRLIHWFKTMKILEWCLIGFTLCCASIIFPNHIYGVLAVLGSAVVFGGVAWPICTGVISNAAPQEIQGKILGVSQSIQSFAMTVGPLIGGVAFHFSSTLPFLIAAGIGMFAVLIYYLTLRDW